MKHQFKGISVQVIGAAMLGVAVLLSSGCATIMHGGPRTISVNTQPTGAKSTISKEETGEMVSVNTTPFTVSLDPKGGFFKGQAYKIKFELPGYQSTEVSIQPSMSGWYITNVLFGGVIGLLIVDPATGAMWNLSPEKVEQKLSASQASLIKSGKGFVVVMASQVTEKERSEMVRIQ